MNKLKNMKLFSKIFLLTISLFSLFTLLVHISIYFLSIKYYVKNEERNIQSKANEIARSLQKEDIKTLEKIIDIYSENNDIKINIKNNKDNGKNSFKINEGIPSTNSNLFIIEEKEVILKDNSKVNLQFIKGKDISNNAKSLSLKYLPYTLLISIAMTIIISYVYTKIILKPIKEIELVINDMKKMDRNAYLKIDSNDEVDKMKETINSLYKTLLDTIDDLDTKNKEIIGLEKKKVEFLRNASHELKTPLASMKIILENMKYNIGGYKDRDKYLDLLIQNIDKANQMIKDIIYISSKNEIKDNKENNNLNYILGEIIDSHKVEIKNKNLKIIRKINKSNIYFDKKRLVIILQNLISNAIKYTDINCKVIFFSDEKCIYIKNKGRKLDDSEIEKCFNLFEKIDEKTPGTGLGLYIVKNILEEENIEYEFKRHDEGMIFTIYLY